MKESQIPASGAPLSAKEVAAMVGGRLATDLAIRIHNVCDLGSAGPQDLSFFKKQAGTAGGGGADKQRMAFEQTKAGLVLVPEDMEEEKANFVYVLRPELAAAQLTRHFYPGPQRYEAGVHPLAHVDAGAQVDASASVGPGCVVRRGSVIEAGVVLTSQVSVAENCRIGAHSYLYPGVVLYAQTLLGSHCLIHANTVIGSDGFGFIWNGQEHYKVPQVGNVEIGNAVEIGANCAVDRATFGTTRIGDGCILDNLVQIGHNCDIGRFVVLCGQVGLAGSTTMEDGVVFGGKAASGGHLTVGAGAQVGAYSAVGKDVPPGAKMAGLPAQDLKNELRARAKWRRLARGKDL